VHTDDPGRALSLGVARGVVEGVEIANMHAQTQEREARLLHVVPDAERPRRLSSPSRQVTGIALSSRAAALASSTAGAR